MKKTVVHIPGVYGETAARYRRGGDRKSGF